MCKDGGGGETVKVRAAGDLRRPGRGHRWSADPRRELSGIESADGEVRWASTVYLY